MGGWVGMWMGAAGLWQVHWAGPFTVPVPGWLSRQLHIVCQPPRLASLRCTPRRVDDDQAKRGIKPTDWKGTLGRDMDGWPGEKWVNVSHPAVRTIMQKRLKYCANIKCDGVDPGERCS